MNDTGWANELTGHILIVEDHEPTANLVTEAFGLVAPYIDCQRAYTGAEAVEQLTGELDPTRVPDIVLLDLDLPEMNGFEVLKTLHTDETAYCPPVLVFSSHTKPPNVNKSYALDANTFIAKPDDWDGFIDAVETIMEYWFEMASLPTYTEPGGPARDSDTIIT